MVTSRFAALEPEESPPNNRTEGDVLRARFTENRHRITLLQTLGADPHRSGLVWDKCVDELIPQLAAGTSVFLTAPICSAT